MKQMSLIVRTMTRTLYPFIIVFGIYLVVHGHLTPGGGFQGGAVVASAIALAIVAFGGTKMYRESTMALFESGGLLFFLSLGLIGMSVAFMWNFLANSGGLFGDPVAFGPNPGAFNTAGTIPLMNMAVGLEVVGGLGAIMMALGAYAFEKEEVGQ